MLEDSLNFHQMWWLRARVRARHGAAKQYACGLEVPERRNVVLSGLGGELSCPLLRIPRLSLFLLARVLRSID